jgi:hypothetical protein
MTPRLGTLVVASIMTLTASAAAAPPVAIEGLFGDWADRAVVATDPSGEGGVDITLVRMADTPDWFQFEIEGNTEFDLSELNQLVMLLDTDDDPSTGLQTEGIGAEIRFVFGDRAGRFFANPTSNQQSGTQIAHADISLQTAPTVTSTRFEVALSRSAVISGTPVFRGDRIAMVLLDAGGERVPNSGAMRHTLDLEAAPPVHDIPLVREQASDVRLVNWNALNDSPWNSNQGPRFGRIVAAIDPDILHFQEIYNHSDSQTRSLVASWLGDPTSAWSVAGNNDCKTLSRYPILHSEGIGGNLVSLIDTTAVLGVPLLAFNAHTPCCSDDAGRQDEIDQMLSFLGRVRAGNHPNIPADAAVQITGDLNLVGFAQQLTSLVTGDIVDESTYGGDVAPDVDGSDLLDPYPLHSERRLGSTWRSDTSSFWPGRLDVSIISDSVLEPGRQVIIDTREMSRTRLTQYGLQASDSTCSDHLPLICDVRPPSKKPGNPADLNGDGCVNSADLGLLIAIWNQVNPPIGDLNGDGVIGPADLGLLIGAWTPCP